MNNQPYNFAKGNPAGSLAQSVAGFIAGGLKQRSGVQEKLMEHNMRLRELKKEGKQVRKTVRTQGEVDKDVANNQGMVDVTVHKSKVETMTEAAKRMSRTAQPNTRYDVSTDRVSAVAKTPKPRKAPEPTPVAAPAPTVARAPKPKMRPSMRGKTY